MNRSPLLIGILTLVLVACVPAAPPSASDTEASSSSQAPAAMERQALSVPVAMERIVSSSSKKSSSAKSIIKEESSSSKAPTSSSASSRAWNSDLTADQIAVLRDGGTETPFTSPLVDEHRKGTFVSADCGEPVFRSEQKYDSGTGWPSFWAPISADAVVEVSDTTAGMTRTEIRSKCGGHLGHVFTDGPEPTGLRYCMNGLALRFIPDPVQ